jgi:hypothetical protein
MMTTMTTQKWNVTIGELTESISADLLKILGYSAPYSNDETNTARYDNPFVRGSIAPALVEALATGLHGDAAAMHAIALQQQRRAQQDLETARQKVAELEAKAAEDHRAAEGMALARQKRTQE